MTSLQKKFFLFHWKSSSHQVTPFTFKGTINPDTIKDSFYLTLPGLNDIDGKLNNNNEFYTDEWNLFKVTLPKDLRLLLLKN